MDALSRYEMELHEYADTHGQDVLKKIREVGKLTDEVKAGLDKLLGDFKQGVKA